jgi:hypothetical protein
VDKSDNAVTPLDADLAEELREALQRIEAKLAARGYTQLSHMVEFFGRAAPTHGDRSNPAITLASID